MSRQFFLFAFFLFFSASLFAQKKIIYVLPIKEEIGPVSSRHIKEGFNQAEKAKADYKESKEKFSASEKERKKAETALAKLQAKLEKSLAKSSDDNSSLKTERTDIFSQQAESETTVENIIENNTETTESSEGETL